MVKVNRRIDAIFEPLAAGSRDRIMTDVTSKPFARFEDPLSFFSRAMTKLHSLWVSATYPFASIGGNLSMHSTCILSRRVAPRIKLGNSVIVRKNAWLNVLPDAEGETNLFIGDNSCINAQCTISAKNYIHVDSDVMVSACVLIMDHNHAYEDLRSAVSNQGTTPGGTIRIEQGCWIGHGAAIVCNQGELVLGRNSVVAANALVTKSCPPHSVLVGNPARLARQVDPATGVWTGGAGRAAVSEPVR
jgi:acetyltransferase-like isoleucine patch superfamily enzyme